MIRADWLLDRVAIVCTEAGGGLLGWRADGCWEDR